MSLVRRIDTPLPGIGPRPLVGLTSWPLCLLICLASVAPLLVVDLPPLVDLYGHLGRYAVQTDLANRPEIQPYYSFEWRLIGNLGADLLVQALHGWLGLEMSVRVIVIAIQFLGAAGILAVCHAVHGRVTPFALMALPLLYGFPFNYGFLNFALAMALGMLAFTAWLHMTRMQRTWQARLWLAVAGAAIWVCHTYGWAFLGLLCGSTALAQTLRAKDHPLAAARQIVGACWPLLLPLIPMLLWRADAGGSETGGWFVHLKILWLLSPLRTKWFVLDFTSLLAIYALLYLAARSKHLAFDRRLGIAASLCFACFLILPMCVFSSMFADMRLMPYVLVIALLAISVDRLGANKLKLLSLAAVAFFAGRMVTTGLAYIAQDREIAAALPTMEAIPKGARVAFFVIKPCEVEWQLPVLDHLGGIALARRSVFVNDQWQQPGVNLLDVHYPAVGAFDQDPSQMVLPDGCGNPQYPNFSPLMRQFPRRAFTHVWIIGELPPAMPPIPGLEPLPHAGKGALYRVLDSD